MRRRFRRFEHSDDFRENSALHAEGCDVAALVALVLLFAASIEHPDVHIMIRTCCAWLLVVLAASPFTTPFATCDLGALIDGTPSMQIAALCPSIHHAGAATDCDAASIAPVMARIEIARNSALAALVVPVRTDGHSSPSLDRSRHDEQLSQREFSPQRIILRL
jgi:hypothetical protein